LWVSGRGRKLLTLALLVARVFADDQDATVAANDLALVADLLNAGLDLHVFSLFAVVVPRAGLPRRAVTYRTTYYL